MLSIFSVVLGHNLLTRQYQIINSSRTFRNNGPFQTKNHEPDELVTSVLEALLSLKQLFSGNFMNLLVLPSYSAVPKWTAYCRLSVKAPSGVLNVALFARRCFTALFIMSAGLFWACLNLLPLTVTPLPQPPPPLACSLLHGVSSPPVRVGIHTSPASLNIHPHSPAYKHTVVQNGVI